MPDDRAKAWRRYIRVVIPEVILSLSEGLPLSRRNCPEDGSGETFSGTRKKEDKERKRKKKERESSRCTDVQIQCSVDPELGVMLSLFEYSPVVWRSRRLLEMVVNSADR